jgi:hypothetical protein
MGIFLPFGLTNIFQLIFHFDEFFYIITCFFIIVEIALIYKGLSPLTVFLKKKSINEKRMFAIIFYISLNVLSTFVLVVIAASNL